ncbi:hypothetical protein [Diaphorobacter ruginosibacter]|uniref:hypothetical protein n=1 Tax=Diaphorobacter ruginosibacter TaxID=1715720 RepID=UPI00333E47A7
MKHSVAGVAPDGLAPASLARFLSLFGTAARRSLFDWTRTSPHDAQLALVDASLRGDAVPASTPCVIYVGRAQDAHGQPRNGRWISHLPAEFTVFDLIDALDRAAVFLMDWSTRQRVAASKAAAAPVQAASAKTGPGMVKQDDEFQLTSWVSLDAPYNTGACVRAMALLTRAPVSLRQLCEHSGLDGETACSLIGSLYRRGALRHSRYRA